MITFVLTYKTDSKKTRDAFLSELEALDMVAVCEAEQGCKKYRYYLPCDDESALLLIESWEEEADQKRHTTQPHFKVLQDIKEKYNVVTLCDTFMS